MYLGMTKGLQAEAEKAPCESVVIVAASCRNAFRSYRKGDL